MQTNPRRLYYFMPDEYVVSNLELRRLKISFSDSVNDLFELMPFDFGETEAGMGLRAVWLVQRRKHASTQGFISLSEIWSSPYMWGHYAKNHAGCCLGFDVSGEKHGRPYAYQMNYVKALLPLDQKVLTDENYNKKMVNYAMTTKSEHWSYEKEWRVWCSLDLDEQAMKLGSPDSHHFVHFNDNFRLREVIIGHRSKHQSALLRNHLDAAGAGGAVAFKTARPSFREFKMVEQLDPLLKK